MGKILYFDCASGISGDMTLGALLDLGIEKDYLIQELSKLKVAGYHLHIGPGEKCGIFGTDVDVVLEHDDSHHHSNDQVHSHNDGHSHSHDHTHGHDHSHSHGDHVHRNLSDIEAIIDASELSDSVKILSKKMFLHVAEAEAKIHGKSVNEVHFHEVGAVDSIVDIIGVAILFDSLDIDRVVVSPVHVGTGFVRCAHGKIPVPAPATLEILKGIPVYSTGIRNELVTPTGAAILKAFGSEFSAMPKMSIERIGYGMGKRDLEIANVLRLVLGE